MHVIGVGSTVLLKFVYEMSEGIGHLEKMCAYTPFLNLLSSSEHRFNHAPLKLNFFMHSPGF